MTNGRKGCSCSFRLAYDTMVSHAAIEALVTKQTNRKGVVPECIQSFPLYSSDEILFTTFVIQIVPEVHRHLQVKGRHEPLADVLCYHDLWISLFQWRSNLHNLLHLYSRRSRSEA